MKKEVLDYVLGKTKELIESSMVYEGLKTTAKAFLKAVGTENETEETKNYLAELKADVMPVDEIIQFAGTEEAKQYFGEEASNDFLEHAKKIKAEGAQYCDCAACTAAMAILDKEEEMLA